MFLSRMSRTRKSIVRHIIAVLLATIPFSQSFPLSNSCSRVLKFQLGSSSSSSSSSTNNAFQRTVSQLERLKRERPRTAEASSDDTDPAQLYESLIRQSANSLKEQLKERKLSTKGRKPDLAQRIVDYEFRLNKFSDDVEIPVIWDPATAGDDDEGTSSNKKVRTFAGLKLSSAAGTALGKAKFAKPSPIQQAVIPLHAKGESLIMHAETGSGKTLAYLLPITEQLWVEYNEGIVADGQFESEGVGGYAFILTPTRELAAQVAGVATVLAPPGTVRMVSRPTNLKSDGLKDRGEESFGGRLEKGDGRTKPRLFIGSAKAIMHSLFGDGKMPASPTTKPEAMQMLRNVRWIVLDEVDRLLDIKKTHNGPSGRAGPSRHEKPAAVVAAAVARWTVGRAQIVAASATVGRSLKRELARVLGLSPQESPQVVRANDNLKDDEDYTEEEKSVPGTHVERAVTIPDTVKHYYTSVDTSSTGKLLTNAVYVLKGLQKTKAKRILMVLTKGCGVNTQNAVGALKHFRCEPEPMSLLDVLEADGTDRMIEVHREVTGATGVGQSYFGGNDDEIQQDSDKGYILVTGEDTVRGLHLDGLDVVLVVGRPQGPDEYIHIAGRTGRAGRSGTVINVLSDQHAAAVTGWEKMLSINFEAIDLEEVEKL